MREAARNPTGRSARTRLAAVTIGGATLLAACGGSGGSGSTTTTAASPSTTSSGTPTVAKDPAIAAMVPASIKAKGTLTVATNATYAPDEFLSSNNTIVGFDPELGAALGSLMGLKFHFVNTSFDNIIPSLQNGRYDLGFSSATVTAARAKQVNFVTYFNAGQGFMIKKGSGVHISGLSSICGLKVAVEQGTVEATSAQTQAAACTRAGKPAPKIQTYSDQSAANLALTNGRAQVVMADTPIVSYAAAQSGGKLEAVGGSFGTAPEGIEVPKSDSIAFDQALAAGLNKLIATGVYGKILAKWGQQSGELTHSAVQTS